MYGVGDDRAQSHHSPLCKGAGNGKPKPAFIRDRESRMKRNETTPALSGSPAFDLPDSPAGKNVPAPRKEGKSR